MTTFNFPEYHTVQYSMNPETGYYQKEPQKITFNKLPFELRIEPTQEEKIRSQGANEIIHGRIKNGKYQFFTGLIPVEVAGCYMGNDYEFSHGNKINSLVLFDFSSDNSRLSVYYFTRFYKYDRTQRINFSIQFLNSIKSKENC